MTEKQNPEETIPVDDELAVDADTNDDDLPADEGDAEDSEGDDEEVPPAAKTDAERTEAQRNRTLITSKKVTYVLVGVCVILAVILGVLHFTQPSSNTPAVPTPSASEEAPATPEPSEAEEVTDPTVYAEGLTVETANIVAGDLLEQYGEESASFVQFGMAELSADREGNPAAVSLATYSSLPEDFNWQDTLSYFEQNVGSLPGGDWVATEGTPTNPEIVNIRTIRVNGTYEGYPAEIEIAVFRQTEASETLTVTITSSLRTEEGN